MREIWIITALLLPSISCELSNFTNIEALSVQCEKFVSFFDTLIGNKDGVRHGIVNVAIADYSTELDIDCLIKKGLLDVSEKVVIYGVTKWKFEYPGIEPDFFVYVHDYSKINNLSAIGQQYYKHIKSSTKPIIITSFDNQIDLAPQNSVLTNQISSFFNSLNYVNCLMLNIFGISASVQKYTATLDFHTRQNIKLISIKVENYRPMMESIKIKYRELLPYSYVGEYDGLIKATDGFLIDEFCSRIGLNYKIVNPQRGLLQKTSSARNAKIDIYFDRRSSTTDLTSHEIVNLHETSAERCFLVPRNIPVYKAFANPFDIFVTWFFVMTILLIAFLWKFFKWLQNEELTIVTLGISMLKVFIGLSIDEDRYKFWSLKERCLLIPFLFMSIIIVALYQSFLISTLIVEHPMRSIQSVEILNKSDTRIYQYVEDIDRFRYGKIVNSNPSNKSQHAILTLPKHFDKNLAYAVRCRFGEDFVKSMWNKQEKRQLFDMIEDPESRPFYSTFIVAEDFPFKSKFKFTVTALDEGGVIQFWTNRLVRDSFPKNRESDDDNATFLGIMIFPFIMIFGGIGISFGSFVVETMHMLCYEGFMSLVVKLKIFKMFLKRRIAKGKKLTIKGSIIGKRRWRNSI